MLHHGDALTVLSTLPDASVNCCVTSPPYFGLRDYGVEGQLGLEASPAEYVENLRHLFAQVRRVLADDGTLWLNLGDSYSGGDRGAYDNASGIADGRGMGTYRPKTGVPAKNLLGIPWRVAFALQDDGWILRSDIIWAKPNPMPESVTDRPTKAHEYVFLLAKSAQYWYDSDAVREPHRWQDPELLATNAQARQGLRLSQRRAAGDKTATREQPAVGREKGRGKNGNTESEFSASSAGRNSRTVWSIPTQPFSSAHFAVMSSALAERAIQAGCKPGGTVLDPFSGSGTTGLAAARHGRKYVGVDLNAEYLDLSLRTRLAQPGLNFDTKEAI
jgi:site-specific DNA-methyltransferase (cytosine-N4-specific)